MCQNSRCNTSVLFMFLSFFLFSLWYFLAALTQNFFSLLHLYISSSDPLISFLLPLIQSNSSIPDLRGWQAPTLMSLSQQLKHNIQVQLWEFRSLTLKLCLYILCVSRLTFNTPPGCCEGMYDSYQAVIYAFSWISHWWHLNQQFI